VLYWVHGLSIATAAALLAGCAQSGAGAIPATPVAARAATGELPLTFHVTIRNRLANGMRFTLTPAKDAVFKGPLSFELKPGATVKRTLTIPAFVPETLLVVEAAGAEPSQTVRQELAVVGSSLGCTMRLRRGSGIGSVAVLSRDGAAAAKFAIEIEPANAALRPSPAAVSDYRVTLDNATKTETLNASVTPGRDASLHGPSSFALDPGASKTVLVSDPASATGLVERLRMLDAATDQEQASFSVSERPSVPASPGADEVSVAIAQLFSTHGQEYQALSAQAAAFHDQFVAALAAGAGAFVSTEGADGAHLRPSL
jgi:hypothetical protein